MKHFNIYYNDGAYAGTISFLNKSRKFIKAYLSKVIREDFNTNSNKAYHINFKNIKRSY